MRLAVATVLLAAAARAAAQDPDPDFASTCRPRSATFPGEDEARWSSGERVAFVQHPGRRDRMLIWVREATLSGSDWRPIVADTDEYKIQLSRLMGVLAVHRAARTGASP